MDDIRLRAKYNCRGLEMAPGLRHAPEGPHTSHLCPASAWEYTVAVCWPNRPLHDTPPGRTFCPCGPAWPHSWRRLSWRHWVSRGAFVILPRATEDAPSM